jgi:putative DNA primase/helicase
MLSTSDANGAVSMTKNASHEAALQYAKLGYKVIPILLIPEDADKRKYRKVPVIKAWPEHATTVPSVIDGWWAKNVNLGVGIVTDQIAVVDLDPGADVAAVEGLLGISDANRYVIPTVKTPRGGLHYYYRLPAGLVLRPKTGVLDHVDVKTGPRAFVVAPPSGQNGDRYEWMVPLVHPGHLPLLPESFIRLLEGRATHHQTDDNGDPMVRGITLDGASVTVRAPTRCFAVGTRHAEMFALVRRLRQDGWGGKALVLAVMAANRFLCEEPLPDKEVLDICKHLEHNFRPLPNPQFSLTQFAEDEYHAQVFLKAHERPDGFPIKYVHESDEWLVWEGDRWHKIVSNERMNHLIHKVLFSIYHPTIEHLKRKKQALVEQQSSEPVQQVQTSGNGHGRPTIVVSPGDAGIKEQIKEVDAQLKFFQRARDEICRVGQQDRIRKSLSGHPDITTSAADWDKMAGCFPVINGVLILDGDIRLVKHSKKHLVKTVANVEYDPKATCPKWQEHIEMCLPDDEVRREVQRELGAALLGKNCQFAPIWYGEGKNGKSVTVETLRCIFGDFYATASRQLLDCIESSTASHTEPLMRVIGKRLVVMKELSQGTKLITNAVKHLTSGEMLEGRAPFAKRSVAFEPSWLLLITTNHKPRIAETDRGVWRRMRVIPWEQVIPQERERPYHEVIAALRAEASGILNWLLDGYRDFSSDPYWVPEKVLVATEEYREMQDRLLPFFEAVCEFQSVTGEASRYATDYYVTANDLLGAFLEWAQGAGLRLSSPAHELAEWLLGSAPQHYYQVKVVRKRSGDDRKVTYFGLRLRDTWRMAISRESGRVSSHAGLSDDQRWE